MTLILASTARLSTCLFPSRASYYLIARRSFWKLNKQTLKAPPPPPSEGQEITQQVQSSPKDPSQPQSSTHTPSAQTQSTQNPLTNNQPAHSQPKTKQTTPNSKNTKPVYQPQPPKPTANNPTALLHIPQDGIIYTHEQQWFFRMFGIGVAAQFGAWVFFLDLVGRNPKFTYSLSFPVLGSLIGGIFAYFARELSTHNVRELKLFPGGRAIEIVTYTLFGFRKSEILAIDQVVKPKQPFIYEGWKTKPFPLRFSVLGDKTVYFISFHGNFKEPKCLEYVINGGDIKHLK